ncbi:HNH endonuclease [Serratia nevei]|uniref:HNH endonuclease n=2 Tax=Serratia TaxID=613 RepID=UPI0007451306|nr:hypothetical protein [Serratia nevei]MEC5685294.1 hypothetical protein [Serratia nevei]MEC6068332.1 hypothetical protein [Serratia nevei]CVE08331.1 Uncharacterised protein [Serratia marcescens]
MNKINSFKPFVGGSWDRKDKEIIIFKRLLRKQLLTAQNDCCAYCGLPLGETGKTEIEHLVAKGGPKRPKHVEFTFEVDNLYLSCNLCNSPLKKGTKETIIHKDPISYSNCTFSIVHPRYDTPNMHYSWVVNPIEILIQGISDKGRESIKMFKLDSIPHTEARARIEMSKRFKMLNDPQQIELVMAALQYNP